ncbi:MAG: hypothetical protein EXR92_00195 [Gemmatimonadetes bacterium]|nr:hypothetical protein [Gemmatimonadota bacterium]
MPGPPLLPVPGTERGGIPDLRGARVIMLPLQIRVGAYPDVGNELEYALGRVGGPVEWLMPEDLREAVAQSPGVGAQIDDLPVDIFLVGDVERVGDPLFGTLYRLGALTNATMALLPVADQARAHDAMQAVEISAALVDLRSREGALARHRGGGVGPAGQPLARCDGGRGAGP